MCLMLQGINFQVQVLKPYKSIQESSEKVQDFKAWQLASIEEATETRGSTISSIDGYLSRFMKFKFSVLFFIQSTGICLGFIFS